MYVCRHAYIHINIYKCIRIYVYTYILGRQTNNQPRIRAKRLGEKTIVLTFQRNPVRRKDLNTPTVYSIEIYLVTCPFSVTLNNEPINVLSYERFG